MSEEKDLRKTLLVQRVNGFDFLSRDEVIAASNYAPGYKKYLDEGKTERSSVLASKALAEGAGYVPYVRGMTLNPGTKVYTIHRDKAIMLAHIGQKPLEEGALFAAAHLDAPRLDLKPSPLYEDEEMVFFKTHYYGGIRKYQWVTIPLALHGVVVKKDGEVVDVCVGENEDDPVLVITDLLPHLAQDQNDKKLGSAFPGENLNVLIGGAPYADEGKDRFKLAIMSILNDTYGITEHDLFSAELSLVPAGKARDVGLDRSFIGAYGQDDRVCSYTALTALLDLAETPERTAVCILVDKEEIGSEGITGMQSAWFDGFMTDLCASQNARLHVCFENSICLSADVGNAYDPNYPEVSDKRNNARCNGGALVTKYTGARGKAGASDASAELVGLMRRLFEENGVLWQMGELGKVDQGGGGTVAKFMANRNISTIDVGVPVLSMHAPFELTAKLDVYMLYKAISVFYRKAAL
ncbi:MAG TPA: aminopeptidase [Clostridiales bacterium]|jgi:aspartyl aminopeptidase|nr:aminopeptidase [Clostridiales bacterium]